LFYYQEKKRKKRTKSIRNQRITIFKFLDALIMLSEKAS